MAYVLVFLVLAYIAVTFLATVWVAWPIVETFGNAPWPSPPDWFRCRPTPVRFALTWATVAFLPMVVPILMVLGLFERYD